MCRKRSFPNRQQEESRLRSAGIQLPIGGKKRIALSVAQCPIPQSTAGTCVLVYTLRPQRQPAVVCPCGFHNHYFSDHLRTAVLFRRTINEAHSDHTKMDVLMPAHVAIGAMINLNTSHCSGFPDYSCFSLSWTWIIPRLNHCAGG